MKLFYLFFILSFYGYSQSPYGDWYANIKSANLPLVFHIQKKDNKAMVTMDSPKQKAFDIPAEISLSEGNQIRVEMKNIGMVYEGTYYEDSISGVFVQGAMQEDMTFYPEKKEVEEPKRPQEPQEPFDYDIEEVKFFNAVDSIYLAGTFTKPRTDKPFPAVVLVSGSGPQNRNEEIMGHKPFWVIADYLTTLGYGVLRYDDRGTHQSEGNFGGATTFDFANDAEAAVNYLMKHEAVNPDRIVVMGHSEGGMVANILGARIEDLSGIVSLAGTSIRGDSILNIQTALINKTQTDNEVELTLSKQFNEEIFKTIIASENRKQVKKELKKVSKKWMKVMAKKKLIDKKEIKGSTDNLIKQMCGLWMYEFIKYSPADDIKKIGCHVLVLIGSQDIQVTSKENIKGYQNLLPKNEKAHIVTEMKGLNHLFQKCKTCIISEYAELEETFSMDALEEIRDFLRVIWK